MPPESGEFRGPVPGSASPGADGEAYLRRAIGLAMGGRGRVEPNPMVGCVLVKGGRVIGEGRHERFGGPHAEPNALAACTSDPAGATAYVTLEPCCHTGKKTPPCVPRLIAAGIARVVVGCADPNPAVSGRGIALLRDAGVEVEVAAGACAAEARQLVAPFFARARLGRPYVTLKWAESADGKVGGAGGRPVWISNARSTAAIHDLRSRCDAILIGVNTVLSDDPLLTARGVPVLRPLRRLVLDRDLRTPLSSRLVLSAPEHPLTLYCSSDAVGRHPERVEVLRARGARVVALELDESGMLSLEGLLRAVDPAVTHLLVEPGPTLARGFLGRGLGDRAWQVRSPRRIGEPAAPGAAAMPWPVVGVTDSGGDLLSEHLNPQGGAFFAPVPSADFERAAGRAPA